MGRENFFVDHSRAACDPFRVEPFIPATWGGASLRAAYPRLTSETLSGLGGLRSLKGHRESFLPTSQRSCLWKIWLYVLSRRRKKIMAKSEKDPERVQKVSPG